MTPQRITEIDRRGQSIVAVHSHPAGDSRFSDIDDEADKRLLGTAKQWFDDDRPLGTAVLGADGRVDARVIDGNGDFVRMSTVSVAGEDLRMWHAEMSRANSGYHQKQSQTFGTAERRRNLGARR